MDPRRGIPPCPQSRSNSARSDSFDRTLPFYERSPNIRTGSDIVREAKLAMQLNMPMRSQSALAGNRNRVISRTRRPETPASLNNTRRMMLSGSKFGSVSESPRPASALSSYTTYSDEFSLESISSGELPDESLQRSHSATSLREHLPPISQSRASNVNRRRIAKLRPLSSIQVSLTCDAAQIQLEDKKQNTYRIPSAKGRVILNAKSPISESSGYSSRVSSANSQNTDEIRSSDIDNIVFESEIQPLLNGIAQNNDSNQRIQMLILLQQQLEMYSLMHHKSRSRSQVLKFLFKLFDNSTPEVSVPIIDLILQMKVSGNNLMNISQKIYAMSKIASNDAFFGTPDFLGHLQDAVAHCRLYASAENRQTLLFTLGAMKFWTSKKNIAQVLLDLQASNLLADLLKYILFLDGTTQKREFDSTKSVKSSIHVLVQIVAIIRNFLELGESGRDQIISYNIVSLMVKLMGQVENTPESNKDQRELVLNISRVFSMMSMYENCLAKLSEENDFFANLVHIFDRYHKRQDISVRFLFALGNLLYYSETCQWKAYQQPGLIQILLKQLKYFIGIEIQLNGDVSDSESISSSVATNLKSVALTDDLLVKLVRVIVNISAHIEVGPIICTNLDLLNLLLVLLEHKQPYENEELVLNCLAGLLNISFPIAATPQSITDEHCLELAHKLTRLAFGNNEKASAEALAVLGNLSKIYIISNWLIEEKAYEQTLKLLSSTVNEISLEAAGLLINLSTDPAASLELIQLGAIKQLSNTLTADNVFLNFQICQLCWNLLIRPETKNSVNSTDAKIFLETLLPLTEDNALSIPDDTPTQVAEALLSLWEDEFLPVAVSLLEVIYEIIVD